MKAILNFDLRDDQHEFDCAINGHKYYNVIFAIREELRRYEKYSELTEDQYELIGKLREWLHTELLDAGIADRF